MKWIVDSMLMWFLLQLNDAANQKSNLFIVCSCLSWLDVRIWTKKKKEIDLIDFRIPRNSSLAIARSTAWHPLILITGFILAFKIEINFNLKKLSQIIFESYPWSLIIIININYLNIKCIVIS